MPLEEGKLYLYSEWCPKNEIQIQKDGHNYFTDYAKKFKELRHKELFLLFDKPDLFLQDITLIQYLY